MDTTIELDGVVTTFVDGFAYLQRLLGPVESGVIDGIRYQFFANGRRGARFTHEFFPLEIEPDRAIALAHDIAGRSPHLISALGANTPAHMPVYRSAGYEYWGREMLMVRSLDSTLSAETGVPVRTIDDLVTGARILAAEKAAGLPGHPIVLAHLEDSAVHQRWIEVDGQPAAFGRMVILADHAYLSDVVTLPDFRRRGLANAVVRSLLRDAVETGARRCVLVSSEMGHTLYAALGFVDVMPVTGFQTPLKQAAGE